MWQPTHNDDDGDDYITFSWIRAFLNRFSIERMALHTLNYPQLRGNKRQRNTQSLAASRFVSLTWFVCLKTKWLVEFSFDWSPSGVDPSRARAIFLLSPNQTMWVSCPPQYGQANLIFICLRSTAIVCCVSARFSFSVSILSYFSLASLLGWPVWAGHGWPQQRQWCRWSLFGQ